MSVCGPDSELSEVGGYVSSPGYPSPYEELQNCSITLNPPTDNHTIRIELLDLYTESNRRYGCLDYLLLQTPENSSLTNTMLCEEHADIPQQDVYLFSQVTIQFRSDHTEHRRGFLIRYQCKLLWYLYFLPQFLNYFIIMHSYTSTTFPHRVWLSNTHNWVVLRMVYHSVLVVCYLPWLVTFEKTKLR